MRQLAVLLLVSLLAVPALAQVEQGTVTGRVTDSTGAVIPGADVTLTNSRTRVASRTSSNGEGIYTVPYLPAGEYEVRVESPGMATLTVSRVLLTVGLVATVNAVLKPAGVDAAVTVTATAVQLEQQTGSLGTAVGSTQMIELPLLGRNPYALAQLAPGVLPKGGAGAGPIITGGRSNTSEILLDGAETRNSTTNDIAYSPPLEAVHEFRVITNSFSAEYGRSGGGVLTAATRSGTNLVHGSAYEFVRNDSLNANSWANNRVALPRSPFKRNEYGFSLGGPLWLGPVYNGRDRTFFFVNWEQVKQRAPDDIRATVPTVAERAGDFSSTVDGSARRIVIYDPATTRANPAQAGRYIRDPFPDNRIPSTRFDPIALKALAYYPLPNRSTRTDNFVQNNTRLDDTSKIFFRFDHAIGSKHRLFVSHGRQDNERSTPGVNAAFPGEGVNGEQGFIGNGPRSTVVSDTVTIGPRLVTEFRASNTRNVIEATPRSRGFDFLSLGFPQSLRSRAKSLLFPRFAPSDVAALGPDRAGYFTDAEENRELQAHVTWISGKHSVKSGFDFTFQIFNVFRPERPSGLYEFGRTFTQGPDPLTSSATAGYGVATMLLGLATGGQFSDDPTLATSQKFYGWYLQDDWKLRHNLTVNLGLRWEYQTPWTDRFNQLAYFDPDFPDPVTGQKGLLRFSGRDGNPREQSDSDRNNFGPRFGLAWSFREKTVLRLGYGLFYFPGSGGVGAGASDLGSGFLAQTSVFLGDPPAAPNTPPANASLSNAFAAGFLTAPTTGLGGGVTTAFRNWVTPFNHQWNLNVQRMLRHDLLVEAAYVGSRGQRIWVNRQRNAALAKYLDLGTALDDLVANPYFGKITTGSLSVANVRRSQLLLPFPHYTGVTRFRDPVGDSLYHGFTMRVEKKATRGLTLHAAYTLSKQLDNVQERFSGRSSFVDPYDLNFSRSIGDYDRPQYFVASYIYELPFGPGKRWLAGGLAGHLLGVWQISGITSYGSGMPLVITGPSNTRLPGVSAVALRQRSAALPDGEQSIDRWFDTSAFLSAPAFSRGNDSRTQPDLRTPGVSTWDMSIARNQRIRESVNFQIRGELFNAFNTPQFNAPDGSVTSAQFGRITSAASSRVLQIGLRLAF
jgi:hypothetical protein